MTMQRPPRVSPVRGGACHAFEGSSRAYVCATVLGIATHRPLFGAHWWVFSFVTESDAAERCRVGVFIDWQNCYRTARNAFGFDEGPGIPGNVYPLKLALMLARVRLPDQGQGHLNKLRIYSGMASQNRDRRTYSANRRQFQAWRNAGGDAVEVIARTLDYTLERPREKGIDVAISIDLVRTACFEHEHDVVVLVSADTDLLPALELVVERCGAKAVEVASWSGPYWSPKPLRIRGAQIRQHELTRTIYDGLADPTDYGADPRRPTPRVRW
jgi:hypothetical protein